MSDWEAELPRRFEVVEERFTHGGEGGVVLDLLRPRDAEALIDEEAFGIDERLPYWAELWPAAKGLARWILDGGLGRPAGQRVIEMGCGVGLPALATAARGITILATDYYEDALRFVEANARRNGLTGVATRVLDWRVIHGDLGRFDVVLAADVLYEERHARDLAAALPGLVAQEGRAIVADPGRKYRDVLETTMRSNGWTVRELARIDEPAANGAVSRVTLIELQRPKIPGAGGPAAFSAGRT